MKQTFDLSAIGLKECHFRPERFGDDIVFAAKTVLISRRGIVEYQDGTSDRFALSKEQNGALRLRGATRFIAAVP